MGKIIYSKKAELFSNIYTMIGIFVLVIGGIIAWALPMLAYDVDMREDHKACTIYEIQEEFKDDYTKAINLDNVVIEKGEDIVVKLKTENYKLSTTYDSKGNYIDEQFEVIIPGAVVVVGVFIALLYGFVVYCLGSVIHDKIRDKIDEKEKMKPNYDEMSRECKEIIEEVREIREKYEE